MNRRLIEKVTFLRALPVLFNSSNKEFLLGTNVFCFVYFIGHVSVDCTVANSKLLVEHPQMTCRDADLVVFPESFYSLDKS